MRGVAAIGIWLDRLCTGVAILGGSLLLALMLLETVSVLGRSLPELLAFTGIGVLAHPVPGDSEIAQSLTATALFSFLPYCQMRRGHIRVEVFSVGLPAHLSSLLDALWSVLFSILAATLAWRLALGWLNKFNHGDTSMVLHLPEAVPFGAAVLCSILLVARDRKSTR